MRKFVWAGTAIVVLGAAAVYFAADYAARNPNSWFGRCTYVAGYVGSRCNPFTALNTVAHPTATDGDTEVGDVVQVPKPETIPEVPEAIAVEGDEVNEPIKVERQHAFIMPFELDETPTVPPSEETPEPRFGPAEESEVPADVAAPVGEEQEEGTPMPMTYIEETPTCAKCGTCAKGCCAKGTCTKRGAKGCCAKGGCAKTSAKGCCDQGGCAKTSAKGCCDQGTCAKSCETGCGDKGCCNWFASFFGIDGCGKCCTTETKEESTTPTEDATTDDASQSDDVPNAQEDPSYHHQYPSCPYTGCPYPYYNHPPVTTPVEEPRDEAVQPTKKKRKKAAATSQLKSDDLGSFSGTGVSGYGYYQGLGERVDGTGSPKKPVKKPGCGDAAAGEVHPEVDTMEARPTDVEKDPFSDVPF